MKVRLKKLSDQVVVLTGATSGLGLTTARMAAKRGASLVLVARNENALRQLTDELCTHGARAVYVVADVGQEDQVRAVAAEAIRQFGRIDTWINNAGVTIFGAYEQIPTEDMRRLFETNFWGVVYGSLAAAEYLKRQGGALINVGSGFGDRAAPLQGIYSAAKHAVRGFTDSLRVELEHDGAPVSVTLVEPASLNTMLVQHAKNYLETDPRLPPPIYAPEVAAEAILYASEHPKREIYAGGAARGLRTAAHFMPRLVDKGMSWLLYPLQKSREGTRGPARDNLHQPSADLLEEARSGGMVLRSSAYTAAVTHPKRVLGLLIGTALLGAGLLHARRRQAPPADMPP